MIDLAEIRFPDEEHEKPFRVYSNYLADLAGVIAGRYGLAPTLIEGIQAGMRSHKPLQLHRIQKRRHGSAADEEIERSLCRAWANTRSLERNVEDEFIEEANAWMPGQAYFAVHHAMRAVLLAAAGREPRDHRKVLNEISREVIHQRLVFPWSAACEGCPELGSERYIGVNAAAGFSPLSAPDPASAEARIALLLKTTRRSLASPRQWPHTRLSSGSISVPLRRRFRPFRPRLTRRPPPLGNRCRPGASCSKSCSRLRSSRRLRIRRVARRRPRGRTMF